MMNNNNLPKGWCLTTLGCVVELKYGKPLPASKRDGGRYPVYGSNGVVGGHSEPLVDKEGIIVGRKGSSGEVQLSDSPFTAIDTTYYIDELFSQPIKFWYYQLKALPLTQLNRSTAVPGLNREDAYQQQVALPPRAEQEVIADRLDSFLMQIEAIKNRLKSISENLQTFRQSVLTAATNGDLTESWRKGKSLDWAKSTLNSICSSISDGDHQAPPKADSGIPFLVISNISSGKIDLQSVDRWVPEKYYESLKNIRKPKENDILYTVTGSYGIPVIVNSSASFCFQRHIAIIKPDHSLVNYKYLYFYLASPEVYKYAESVATGTAQKTVSLSQLREFEIRLPSIDEQAEIVRQIEFFLKISDGVEQKVSFALDKLVKIVNVIKDKALRGDFTADWRAKNSDLIYGVNSAKALLKEIQEAREYSNKKPNLKSVAAKKISGNLMCRTIFKVVQVLRESGKPLNGQQLLSLAGYSSDSSTEELEKFFLDVRYCLLVEKSIVKTNRDDSGQDWFALAEETTKK